MRDDERIRKERVEKTFATVAIIVMALACFAVGVLTGSEIVASLFGLAMLGGLALYSSWKDRQR